MLLDTIVLTNIYTPFYQSNQMLNSCGRVGLPVINTCLDGQWKGNGDVLVKLYNALLSLRDKFKYAIYSDGADTFFINSFKPPDGVIIYSAEKNCYPDPNKHLSYPSPRTIWRFLNSGNYCGEIELLIKFYETYKLTSHAGDCNGQLEQTNAYLQALSDGFPITLDEECKYFQTLYMHKDGDLTIDGREVINNITKTKPHVIHGNGVQPMQWVYDLYL